MRLIDAEKLETAGWTMNRVRRESPTTMIYETKKPTSFPSVQTWTPTTDRLPDPGRYLVTVKRYGKNDTKTSVSNYNNGTWSGYDAEDVIAWMQMPKPYKEGGSE